MTNTFADLKARIADELNRTDMTGQIGTAVARAIDHYAGRKFWFNRGRATAPTIANNEYVAFPSATGKGPIRVIDSVFITIGSYGYSLKKQPADTIEDWAQTQIGAGQPSDWAYDYNQVRLFQKPIGVFTLTFTGVFDLTPLVADGDANAWTTEAQDLIVARAEFTINRDIIKDDQGTSDAQAAETAAYERLVAETTRRQGTGRIRPHD